MQGLVLILYLLAMLLGLVGAYYLRYRGYPSSGRLICELWLVHGLGRLRSDDHDQHRSDDRRLPGRRSISLRYRS